MRSKNGLQSRQAIKPLFGRSLQDLYAEGKGLPNVFWDTLRLLSLNALTTPGLFRSQCPPRSSGRRSGGGQNRLPVTSDSSSCSDDGSTGMQTDEAEGCNSGRKVLLCKRLYDSGQDALQVLPSTTKDVHAVAGVLKLWITSLPEAVVPPRLYSAAVDTQTHPSREAQVAALHSLLRQCEHRVLQVLYPLMEFLHHYCLNQRNARRERQELAKLFAPLLLRPGHRSVMSPAEDAAVACVEHMIREYRTLFVARKRAVVPPTLPTAAKPAPQVAAAVEPAVLVAAAPQVAPASGRGLTLKVGTPTPEEVQAQCSSPDSDDTTWTPAEPEIESAVADLLFGTTSSLFCEPSFPQTAACFTTLSEPAVAAAAPISSPFAPTHGVRGSAFAAALAADEKAAAAVAAATAQQQSVQQQQQSAATSFFATSPSSSPDTSPGRCGGPFGASPVHSPNQAPTHAASSASQQLAFGGSKVLCDVAMGEGGDGCGDSPLASPTSIPGGWGAMSDGDTSGSENGSDSTVADAAVFGGGGHVLEDPCASYGLQSFSPNPAAAGSGGVAFGGHIGSGVAAAGSGAMSFGGQMQQPPPACARVLAWDAPSGAAGSGVLAAGVGGMQGGGNVFGQAPMEPPSLLERPCNMVQYQAPGTELPTAVSQLAAEKAALKRQLRQLDADFEASTGRAPGRAEKEALRPLYVRYWRLKRALEKQRQAEAAAAAAHSSAPCDMFGVEC